MICVRAAAAKSTRSVAGEDDLKKVAAFLFDLDGTLIDTENVWTRAIVDFVVSAGGKTTMKEMLTEVVGRNWLDIDRRLHELFPELGNTSAMQDAIKLREFYNRHAGDPQTMRIESSIEFFKKAAKIAPCAIVSGSPHDDVVNAAAICGLADMVELVIGAEDCDAGKPSPSGYLKAASLLGVEPKDCVVIEDSTVGVQAGVAAGMTVVALTRNTTVPQRHDGATYIIENLDMLDPEKEFSS